MTLQELVAAWGGLCVICGQPFDNLDCVSREHLVPKSMGGKLKDNLAPSHHSCNHARGSLSIIQAQALIEARRMTMSPSEFQAWLNKPVPDVAKLVANFGRECVDAVRLTWDVETKWPWWKFPKIKRQKKRRTTAAVAA